MVFEFNFSPPALGLDEDRVLGGSWVVTSRVKSPLIWVIAIVTLIIPPL